MAQLDVFGGRVPDRPRRVVTNHKGSQQQSLFGWEHEQQADADFVREALERFRELGRGDDEPPTGD